MCCSGDIKQATCFCAETCYSTTWLKCSATATQTSTCMLVLHADPLSSPHGIALLDDHQHQPTLLGYRGYIHSKTTLHVWRLNSQRRIRSLPLSGFGLACYQQAGVWGEP